jgi:hypothetical protein
MMRIALEVKYVDGRAQKIMVSAPDLVAFERHFDKPMAEVASGRIEYLWWVAWHATTRKHLTEADFDSWIETIDEIGDDNETSEEIVPLENNQLTG